MIRVFSYIKRCVWFFILEFTQSSRQLWTVEGSYQLIEAGRQFFPLQFPRTLKKFRNRGSQIVLFVAHQVNNKKTQLDEGDVYLFSFFKFFFCVVVIRTRVVLMGRLVYPHEAQWNNIHRFVGALAWTRITSPHDRTLPCKDVWRGIQSKMKRIVNRHSQTHRLRPKWLHRFCSIHRRDLHLEFLVFWKKT